MRVAAVVPTCRGFKLPEQSREVDWIIVHDREKWPITGKPKHEIVAPDSKLYGVRCDSIRSAGFAWAIQQGYDLTLTVDDDCEVPLCWADSHVEAITRTVHPWSYTTDIVRTRGLPYEASPLKVAISHGLWNGVPDLDARTQKQMGGFNLLNPNKWQRIHPPFPQSSMNLGFIREVGVVMYQPAQGEGFPFDRFADIWGGVMAQRCLSLHGYGFMNGGACVRHMRASNVDINLVKEGPGMECHETFWRHVWRFHDRGDRLANTYAKLAWHVASFDPPRREWRPYFRDLKDNMLQWLDVTHEV